MTLVDSKAISFASLHNRLPTKKHLYTIPFACIYLLWIYVYLFNYDDFLGSYEFSLFTFMLIAATNILALLVCQWSVSARAFLTCSKVHISY